MNSCDVCRKKNETTMYEFTVFDNAWYFKAHSYNYYYLVNTNASNKNTPHELTMLEDTWHFMVCSECMKKIKANDRGYPTNIYTSSEALAVLRECAEEVREVLTAYENPTKSREIG